jgi:hypothetical protein
MKKFSIVLCALALLAFSCALFTPQAAAQAVFGSIFSTVTDPSGAAVPGVKVVVTSATKGTSQETTTNADGNYSVTHLIPDVYNVRAEGAGFKAFEAKNIVVSADAAARVDGQFQVGGSTETVEVTAEAPQLKTDRADVATIFNDKAVEDLPLFNRNFTSLVLASPGAQQLDVDCSGASARGLHRPKPKAVHGTVTRRANLQDTCSGRHQRLAGAARADGWGGTR